MSYPSCARRVRIRSNRRSSIEIDRPRLEAAACECYQLMRRRIDRIVLTEETHRLELKSPCLPTRTTRGGAHPRRERPANPRGPLTGLQRLDGATPVAGRMRPRAYAISLPAREPRPPGQTIRDWPGRSNKRCARKTPGWTESSPDPLSCPSGSRARCPGHLIMTHAHPVPPLLDFLCRRHVASPPAGMRPSRRGALVPADPGGLQRFD